MLSRKLDKKNMINFILDMDEHRWIKESKYISLHIEELLERLPLEVLTSVFIKKSTFFLIDDNALTTYTSALGQNIIPVGSRLKSKLTKTIDGWSKGLLAHEIGHIYIGHSRTDDPIEALVDADEFACKMGFVDEIEAFLHDQAESVDKMVRLSFISSFYFKQEENLSFI